MTLRWNRLLLVGICVAPTAALAQQTAQWSSREQPSIMVEERQPSARPARSAPALPAQPELDEEDQLAPSQMQPAPRATGTPRRATPARVAAPAEASAPTRSAQGASAAQPAAAAASRTVACSGAFAMNSSHMKLATTFDSRNLVFTEVDGPEGSKVNASVLFPSDPKRRLEVWWKNEPARSDTALIVINGQSAWSAPKGLRLGLTLASLERLNGKPFTLAGFDQDNGGSVLDWNGGALAALPGGCTVGVRLGMDRKASEAARNEAAGKELASNHASVRAVRPTVTEILIGYPQDKP